MAFHETDKYKSLKNRETDSVAKVIKDFGDRVQYSVFECLLDQALLGRMTDRIKKIVVEKDDSVRIYSLCAGCEKAITIIGQGEVTREEDVYIL